MVVVRGGASAVPEYPVAIQVAIQVAVHNGYARSVAHDTASSCFGNKNPQLETHNTSHVKAEQIEMRLRQKNKAN